MQISVVMASYNGAKYLEQQILSILSQTLQPFEIIICDDGSTDGTVEILQKYTNRLTYVINDRQLGLIGNFRKAVSLAAEGNYVALSDQDDVWFPDKLEKCAAVLREIEDPRAPCLVHSDLLFVDENDRLLNNSFKNEQGHDRFQHNLRTLLFGNFVNGNTMLMNAELRKFFAFIPTDVSINHDGWLALIAYTFGKAAYIPLPLLKYRKHENNLSIAQDIKPRNRYRSTLNELISSMRGKRNFLSDQFKSVRQFYSMYSFQMKAHESLVFEEFLKLESKGYFFKKLAYRKAVNEFIIPKNS